MQFEFSTGVKARRSQAFFFLIIILFVLFIYLVLAVLGLHCCTGFSLVVASGGHSPVAVSGFSSRGFSCCDAQALGHTGFRSCCTWAQKSQLQGPGAQAQ